VTRIAVLVLALGGCAKILGLDDTHFDQKDAGIDAPGVCDGLALACTVTTGRSVCGQLFGTGDTAGMPLRVAAPTGAACAIGDTEGPCALAIGEQKLADFFAGASGRLAGSIDDCGRYAVVDTNAGDADIAVVMTGTGFTEGATVEVARSTVGGQIDKLDMLAISDATLAAWQAQIPGSDLSSGYLVRYETAGVPRVGEEAALSGGNPLSTTTSTTVSWAAYFGDLGFGALSPALTSTQLGGTAVVVPHVSGAFDLQGFRSGHRCTVPGLQSVGNALIFVVETDC
jgi:hypothetical protein